MYKRFILALLAISLLFTVNPVKAQESTEGPTYIVQAGDTLWDIASRFNVNLDDLMAANGLTDGNLVVGQEVIIPGLEGVSGVLRTETVPYGDNLRSRRDTMWTKAVFTALVIFFAYPVFAQEVGDAVILQSSLLR